MVHGRLAARKGRRGGDIEIGDGFRSSDAVRIRTLEMQVRTLEQEVDVLKVLTRTLKDDIEACYFAPGMPGFVKSQRDFANLDVAMQPADSMYLKQLERNAVN